MDYGLDPIVIASRSIKEIPEETEKERRYYEKQKRLLKQVHKSAKAIRALNKIARPFLNGEWELHKEELQSKGLPVTGMVSTRAESEESSDEEEASRPSFRRIIWSPEKPDPAPVVKAAPAIDKIPQWTPLRRSKARLSQFHLNAENACNKPSGVATPDTCKPSSAPPAESTEESRSPLKAVSSFNHVTLREKRISRSDDCKDSLKSTQPYDSQAGNIGEKNDKVVSKEASNLEERSEEAEIAPNTPSRTLTDSSLVESSPIRRSPRFLRIVKSPVRCSPILRQAFGEENAMVRGSIVSPDKFVNLEDCTSPKDPSKVLKGIVAYVEVRRGEDDRTGGFRWKLKQLGATVSDTLNKKVTHVVFQEGLLSTYRKAKQLGAHLVSTHWVMACDETFTRVSEARYPIEKLSQYEDADPRLKSIKRPKIMSPDLDSGRDEKRLSRRLKTIERRSMRVDSPLTKTPVPEIALTASFTEMALKRRSPSPKAIEPEPIDDWDGFLAMVEAKVREESKSQMESQGATATVKDFETRLQELLGRKNKQSDESNKTLTPLAPIFERGNSTAHPIQSKRSPKKDKTLKPTVDSAASSSVMMKWLQRRSPNSSGTGTDVDTTVVTVSTAADEILKSIFKKVEAEQIAKAAASSKDMLSLPNKINPSGTESNDVDRATLSSTSKSENVKSTRPVKQAVRKNKLGFNGSAACSDMMKNWLSGSKSIAQTKKTPVKVPEKETAALTPRRRSSRLTPIKTAPTPSKRSQLDSVDEVVGCADEASKSFTSTAGTLKSSKVRDLNLLEVQKSQQKKCAEEPSSTTGTHSNCNTKQERKRKILDSPPASKKKSVDAKRNLCFKKQKLNK